MRAKRFVAGALAAGLALAAQPGRSAVVETPAGAVRGVEADGILAFKGIPYAAPPVGEARWRAPGPPVPWQGVRDASAFVADCPQAAERLDPARPSAPLAEDCLTLNVWRPAGPPGEALPVLVWIHGGGYVQGGSSAAIYDGSALAARGLVIVSLNYRLGRFGFFAHPALIDAREGPVGNFALMDMAAALVWVQEAIGAFGGDPARVTVMGESAGGDAVMHLIASPRARGLFTRAIVLSGDGRGHLLGGLALEAAPGVASATAVGQAFAAAEGISGTGADALAELRALPAERLTEGTALGTLAAEPGARATYAMGPIEDGDLVPAAPGQVLAAGGGAEVAVMIGTTSIDLPLRAPPQADPLSHFGSDRATAARLYGAGPETEPRALRALIGADMTMHEPARFVAREIARQGRPAFLYRFDYVAEHLGASVPGATHASELPFLFGTLDARYGAVVSAADRAVSAAFQGAIAAFARTGRPDGGGLAPWPAFDPDAPGLMLFGRDGAAAHGPDPWGPRLDLVAAVADAALYGLPADLIGTRWVWTALDGPEGTLAPPDPRRYTLEFLPDDRVALGADCNRGTATAGAPEPGRIRIGEIAQTLALCEDDGLGDRFLAALGRAATWTLGPDGLTLSTPEAATMLRFAPGP